MTKFDLLKADLSAKPKRWLVTGVAGFIGSNLLEALLQLGQSVTGLDNFLTGYSHNLQNVKEIVGPRKWSNFTFIEGDIRKPEDCRSACDGVDFVLHQAALGSVPRSIEDPIATNQSNVDGFLNMLMAVKDAGIRRMVFASSSSVYGDSARLPKVEHAIGNSLSPYATSKLINELYADVASRVYSVEWIGLRYFNVYGKRQDPKGAYAAVIPRWINALMSSEKPMVYGDGETSRDFCFIQDVVQANLLAAVSDNKDAVNNAYNIAYGARTTLNDLLGLISRSLARHLPETAGIEAERGPFREGDVRHSHANVSKARELLGFEPQYTVERGIAETIEWYVGAGAAKAACA
ncbi:MAG: SDR family oxidoreductase [Desulfobacteraceae bacterium]|nr:SDR family oxidoreductase [Desulfobacteraceae bacterium]